MRLHAVEIRRVVLPLATPFRTSSGTQIERDLLVLRALADGPDGWSECAAMAEPLYSPEHVDGAHVVIRDHLLPRVLALPDVDAERAGAAMASVKGHPMARAAVETAVLDAELRATGIRLADRLGATRDVVDAGVSLGIMASVDELLDVVGQRLAEGYRRVKLKIEPGWDVEPVQAVRERFGPDLALQVDANGAYDLAAARHLAELDRFDLLLIEQPLADDDLQGHARLAPLIRTPICLDESITSLRAAELAIDLGACAVVNLKPGRVGGYLEAVRIHDACVARGVPVWCGGMLETGIGRAANVALAALPGFTLPGDLSASDRWYDTDLTDPFVLHDGRLRVPGGSGIGVEPRPDVLERHTTSIEVVRRG